MKIQKFFKNKNLEYNVAYAYVRRTVRDSIKGNHVFVVTIFKKT